MCNHPTLSMTAAPQGRTLATGTGTEPATLAESTRSGRHRRVDPEAAPSVRTRRIRRVTGGQLALATEATPAAWLLTVGDDQASQDPAGWWWARAAVIAGLALAVAGAVAWADHQPARALAVAALLTLALVGNRVADAVASRFRRAVAERRALGRLLRQRERELGLAQTALATIQARLARCEDELGGRSRALVAARVEVEMTAAEIIRLRRVKSSFLATMSHELRTPLTKVVGGAALLERTELNDAQTPLVQMIAGAGGEMTQLVDDLLELASVDAGAGAVACEPVAVRDTTEDAIAAARERAEAHGLAFSLMIDPDVPVIVDGDARRIRTVLGHLVDNAVKFTERGRVDVRVSVARDRSDRAGLRLRFDVADTGVGIDPALLPAMFSPFHQGDGSKTRRYRGTGIGLALCSRLVSLMSGELDAVSTPGVGSTFSFTIATGAVPARASSPSGASRRAEA